MLPQNETESILLARLRELGGDVVRRIEVTEIAAEEYGATLTTNAGTIRASRVVGCDGMHSIVREQAGIGFEGGEYEELFVLADVQMDWPLGREIVLLFLSPDGLAVVVPLPGDTSNNCLTSAVPSPAVPWSKT